MTLSCDLRACLENRRVLVISPQRWDFIHVSKHHYAKEIAKHASHVYFLELPSANRGEFTITQAPEFQNISVVKYGAVAPRWIRFKARWLYELLGKRMVQKISSELGPFDLVWCFDTNLYPNPKAFGGTRTLYHVVDPIPFQRQVDAGNHADAVVSVSPKILSRFEESVEADRLMVVNHGLSPVFLDAQKLSSGDRLKFGYSGNLTRPQIDHAAFTTIINGHPDIEFHFWGPYENATAGSAEAEFVAHLVNSENVHLHGRVSTEVLAEQIQSMSGFLLAYMTDGLETDNSNSHKILEYLSTGRVVVSKQIQYYEGKDLLEMSASESSEAFVALFEEVVSQIDYHNRDEAIQRRRAFASTQTYADQLQRIAALLVKVGVRDEHGSL